MLSLANASGYTVATRLINSIEYGAPQDRDRIIVVGISSAISQSRGFPVGGTIEETHFPWSVGRTHNATILRDARWPVTSPFGSRATFKKGLPKELTVSHWFARNDVANHPNAKHGFIPRAGLARFKQIEEGDVSRKSFKRLHRFRFSPTACYGNNEVHLHPNEARRISVAEALAIQSLPKDFVIDPSLTLSNMFKTIGNGVPFLVSRGLAKMVATLLELEDRAGGAT
jgi:DNA (cytosine-5)-methyltransferase 1